jgi:two-component system, NarL family, nitrate/nitrite response regulator NarL
VVNRIRVGLVDEHPIFRDGVAYILASHPEFAVVGQGQSVSDAVRIAMECEPDVLVIDHNLPGGMAAISDIARQCPAVKVMVLTFAQGEDQVHAALRCGARGYLLKGASGSELVQTIRAVNNGELYVSPGLAAKLLLRASTAAEPAKGYDPISDLTSREKEILTHIVDGRSNREIGDELSLSEKTIKFYVTGILQKLKVRNRVEAAILAFNKIPQRNSLSR